MDFADWNRGLLLGALLIVIGGMSLVSGRTVRDRLLAVGILSQGVLMTFVAGSVYLPRAELEIAAIAVVAIFGLWSVWFFHVRQGPPQTSGSIVALVTMGGTVESPDCVTGESPAMPTSARDAE